MIAVVVFFCLFLLYQINGISARLDSFFALNSFDIMIPQVPLKVSDKKEMYGLYLASVTLIYVISQLQDIIIACSCAIYAQMNPPTQDRQLQGVSRVF